MIPSFVVQLNSLEYLRLGMALLCNEPMFMNCSSIPNMSYHTTHQACCLLVKSFVRRKQLATSQQCIQRHSNLFWSLKVSLFVKHRAMHKYTKYTNTMLHNLSTALLSKFDAPKHKTLKVRTSPAGSRKHLQTWDTEAPIHFIFK